MKRKTNTTNVITFIFSLHYCQQSPSSLAYEDILTGSSWKHIEADLREEGESGRREVGLMDRLSGLRPNIMNNQYHSNRRINHLKPFPEIQ